MVETKKTQKIVIESSSSLESSDSEDEIRVEKKAEAVKVDVRRPGRKRGRPKKIRVK